MPVYRPMSQKQWEYLKALGWKGVPPKTAGMASHLIERLEKEREEKRDREKRMNLSFDF